MKVVLCAGGGIGNVVMATPAAEALLRLGFEVSLYLQPEAAPAAGLLRGWSALRDVITRSPPEPRRFDLAVHTVWSSRRGIHPDERSPPQVDLRNMHEAEANMIPVRALGYAGALPPAHVETDASPPRFEPGSYWALAPGCKPGPFWERKRWDGWDGLTGGLGGVCVILGAAAEACSGASDPEPRAARAANCPGAGAPGAETGFELRRSAVGRTSRTTTWNLHPAAATRTAPTTARVACRSVTPFGSAVVDLTGRTTLGEAAAWIAGARVFVGIDNGLAHVAAALGCPTVVLFGATSEVKNRPLGPRVRLMTRDLPCRPCQMTSCWDECTEWRCMGFSVAEVAEAARAAADGFSEDATPEDAPASRRTPVGE